MAFPTVGEGGFVFSRKPLIGLDTEALLAFVEVLDVREGRRQDVMFLVQTRDQDFVSY